MVAFVLLGLVLLDVVGLLLKLLADRVRVVGARELTHVRGHVADDRLDVEDGRAVVMG